MEKEIEKIKKLGEIINGGKSVCISTYSVPHELGEEERHVLKFEYDYPKEERKAAKKQLRKYLKSEDEEVRIAAREGYGLNSKIEKTDVKANNVYKVIDGELFFYVCLDQEIKDKTIDELKLKKENMFICLDKAVNDSKKKNLSIQCNLKTI